MALSSDDGDVGVLSSSMLISSGLDGLYASLSNETQSVSVCFCVHE